MDCIILTSCAGTTVPRSSRISFVPKLQHFLSFKCIWVWTRAEQITSYRRAERESEFYIVHDSVTRYGPQSVASASGFKGENIFQISTLSSTSSHILREKFVEKFRNRSPISRDPIFTKENTIIDGLCCLKGEFFRRFTLLLNPPPTPFTRPPWIIEKFRTTREMSIELIAGKGNKGTRILRTQAVEVESQESKLHRSPPSPSFTRHVLFFSFFLSFFLLS